MVTLAQFRGAILECWNHQWNCSHCLMSCDYSMCAYNCIKGSGRRQNHEGYKEGSRYFRIHGTLPEPERAVRCIRERLKWWVTYDYVLYICPARTVCAKNHHLHIHVHCTFQRAKQMQIARLGIQLFYRHVCIKLLKCNYFKNIRVTVPQHLQ